MLVTGGERGGFKVVERGDSDLGCALYGVVWFGQSPAKKLLRDYCAYGFGINDRRIAGLYPVFQGVGGFFECSFEWDRRAGFGTGCLAVSNGLFVGNRQFG